MFRRRLRKRYFRTRRTVRRRSRTFGRRVMRAVRQRAEKKYRDAAYNQAVTTTALLTAPLQLIAQGATQNDRVGQKIFLRYIKMRFEFYSNAEDLLFFRVALVRGRTTGLALADTPSGVNAGVTFIDIEKFEIVWESYFSLGDSDTDGRNKRFINKTCRIMRTVTYNGQDVIPIVNPFYLYVWSSDVVPTVANFIGVLRMYYNDI